MPLKRWPLPLQVPNYITKTCPKFEFSRVVDVSLRNLRIERCDLGRRDNVEAIIETDACPRRSRAFASILLRHVEFLRNRNLDGSVGLIVKDPSCYSVRMRDVTFQSNVYARGSELSETNELRSIQFIRNALFDRVRRRESLIYFPQDSDNSVHHLRAENNQAGILSVVNGTLEVRDSIFSNNAANETGTIEAVSARLSITASVFESNTCNGNGAAVFLSESNGTFFSVDFVNNLASEGGAIYASDPEIMQITSSAFESNSAEGFGALSIITTGSEASIRQLEISNCIFRQGSGIYIRGWHQGSIQVHQLQFMDNYGAFEVYESENMTLSVTESAFDANHGVGAASFGDVSGEFTIHSTEFIRNEVGTFLGGGAVSIFNPAHAAVFTFDHAHFEENAVGTNGGAVYVDGAGADRIRMLSTQFIGNKATNGGAVFIELAHSLLIRNCTFVSNTATEQGGAIRTDSPISETDLQRSRFRGNSAESGGAVHSRSNIAVEHCVFENNEAELNGGAVDFADGSREAVLIGSTFVRNRAVVGGALHFAKAFSRERAEECIFDRNRAELYGGAVYMIVQQASDYVELDSCTFTSNHATQGGKPSLARPQT